jgi:hypothetical protein
MKKNHPYYDLQELVNERWKRYSVTEKDLIKWGADRKLQFCARLTPPAKHFSIEIECGYTEYVEDSSFRVPCERKQINYGDHSKPYRLHPKTLDNLSNHVLDNKVKPVILTDCEWCEWKCELYKNKASGVYTSYEISPCNSAKSSPGSSNQDLYWPTVTKDDLLVCRSEVIRFGDILERECPALSDPSTDDENGNNQLAESSPSTLNTPENNDAKASFKKEKWYGQVKHVEFPDGTETKKIEFRFKTKDKVIISAVGTSETFERDFESLGFRNNQLRKEKEWNSAWLLLHDIAVAGGVFDYNAIAARGSGVYGSQNKKVVQIFKDTLVGINKRLKFAIPLFEDDLPIKHTKSKIKISKTEKPQTKEHWLANFKLGLTASYQVELSDGAPNTDSDPNILMALTNDQGHIHDISSDGRKDHFSKD